MTCCQREELHAAGDKQCFWADQECVGASLTSVAKAVSMPLFMLAVTTSSCRPMAKAAVCNSDKKG
jgi:hypothetical protein